MSAQKAKKNEIGNNKDEKGGLVTERLGSMLTSDACHGPVAVHAVQACSVIRSSRHVQLFEGQRAAGLVGCLVGKQNMRG